MDRNGGPWPPISAPDVAIDVDDDNDDVVEFQLRNTLLGHGLLTIAFLLSSLFILRNNWNKCVIKEVLRESGELLHKIWKGGTIKANWFYVIKYLSLVCIQWVFYLNKSELVHSNTHKLITLYYIRCETGQVFKPM